jgi:hypothetical protein
LTPLYLIQALLSGVEIMFEIGKEYSREDIHQVTGGCKQAFLPMKGGKVVAARLRQDLNPYAPDVIVATAAPLHVRPVERLRDRLTPFPFLCELHPTAFVIWASTSRMYRSPRRLTMRNT